MLNFQNNNKRMNNFIFLVLSTIFMGIAVYTICGETIPYKNGAGFDGEFYRNVFENFSSTFFSTGYDSFRIHRIFPFCLLNLIYEALSIPLTENNMQNGMYIAHVTNFIFQLFLFYKFSRFLRWKTSTTIILFGLFFFNFATLKQNGYIPFCMDSFSVTIFFASYLLHLKNKYILSLLISFLGLITWPVVTYAIIILHLFRKAFPPNAHKLKFNTGRYYTSSVLLFSASAVVFLILLDKRHILENLLLENIQPPLLLASFAAWALLLCIIMRFTYHHFYTPVEYLKHTPWLEFFPIVILFTLIEYYLGQHTNQEFYFSATSFFLQILVRPLKFPLISIVAHVCYFGLLPIFILAIFRNFAKFMFDRTPGHAIVFVVFLLFASDSESRHAVIFLPLLLLPLGNILDKQNIPTKMALIFSAIQLALSHFYIPINSDELTSAFQSNNFFIPATQNYFMNYGPWMTWQSYSLWAGISIISAIYIFFFTRNWQK